ncbi:ThyB [Tritrichomonas foetus]|uniref:thymidine kinase n=1 Tax=Tritrichomonas foetus TaxID=1144522 RepID=A0A1J4KEN1_9EUKA|nr:ThyB [Tritrichomonas foetus]|eukprot:OHT09897.1 ThyB [Tritrichomonas foetus]
MSTQAGRIELIVGPMFAGKTTEMLRRVDRAELAHKKCVVMKYSKDTRYSAEQVATHDMKMRTAIPCCELLPHMNECKKFDVVGVDEGQFFPDVVEFAEELANNGKIVIVAGLDGDFLRKPFGRVIELMSRSESITKLTAVCTETGGDACFTQRTVDSQDLELIGGADMYRAASRTSYFHKEINGEIHLTLGPVQSGKTTELLRVLNRHKIAGRNPILIRPNSNHYENKSIKINCITKEELPPIEDMKEYEIIGVDEAQRYPNIAHWADQLANSGKLVIISALDSDPERKPYQNIITLFPLCEKVQKLEAVCPFTGLSAPFSVIMNGVKVMPISRFALLQKLVTLC